MNQNHSGYSGAGFVDKLEAAGAGVTFYAKVANAGDYDVTFRYANGDAAERSLSVYVNGSYIGKTICPPPDTGTPGGLPDAASAGGRKQHHHS